MTRRLAHQRKSARRYTINDASEWKKDYSEAQLKWLFDNFHLRKAIKVLDAHGFYDFTGEYEFTWLGKFWFKLYSR